MNTPIGLEFLPDYRDAFANSLTVPAGTVHNAVLGADPPLNPLVFSDITSEPLSPFPMRARSRQDSTLMAEKLIRLPNLWKRGPLPTSARRSRGTPI